MNERKVKDFKQHLEVAVIGMAGRFPGAKNIDEFWDNLINGVESITFFSSEELEKAGVAPELLNNPKYVKANGILKDYDCFDASFFDYTPREAEMLNPQTRILLECSWEALENAGYNSEIYKGAIGFYAGASSSLFWEGLSILSGKTRHLGDFTASNLADKDFLCTTISYKLGLKGPSCNIQTACSTSLVAIHLACRGVLSGECHIALAGGITVGTIQNSGYIYQEGMIFSPDGHCRVFDAKAGGSISGNGVGIVVLKRLKNAIEDGDNIYAVVKGSAINNDGKRKVGFTAPSVQGQAEVIRTALAMARIEPQSIGYVEAHGTGTMLGDPVEIEALKLAFNTGEKNVCPIGSVKSNMGHLDAAAGVAGFIKTILILMHRLIPPSLHFETPNPKIDFENSPFYVNSKLKEWEKDKYPLRAGVSSFGIGGTNAHVVLEEAPGFIDEMKEPSAVNPRLILVSAKTPDALELSTQNLADYFKNNTDVCLADVAYTLQVGRKAFKHRRMSVCSTVEEAAAVFQSPLGSRVHTALANHDNPPVVFMFSGLGAQYLNMALDLYRTETLFREAMNSCFAIIDPLLNCNFKNILFPVEKNGKEFLTAYLNRTSIAQLGIFILEYALARLLMKWGIVPYAMIGYSFGEYTAACIAGVFSLEDALKAIVSRGQLIEKIPAGVMLSIPLTRDELSPLLTDDVSLAIDNGPSCIAAGTAPAMEDFERQMKERKLLCMRLQTSHAIHSKMMNPILEEYEQLVGRFDLKNPRIPYMSNVTGHWITDEEAVNPAYWAKHLGNTIQFAAGVRKLVKEPHAIFVEIGPGRDLTTLLMRYLDDNLEQKAINLLRHPQKNISDAFFLLKQIGRLWMWGVDIDWDGFYAYEKRLRIPLPTYPFERQRYWFNTDPSKRGTTSLFAGSPLRKNPDMADWFYISSWKYTRLPAAATVILPSPGYWLLFTDDCGLGSELLRELEGMKQKTIVVKIGPEFRKHDDFHFILNPRNGNENQYDDLFSKLSRQDIIPEKIIYLWSVEPQENSAIEPEDIEKSLDLNFYSLLNIARAVGNQNTKQKINLTVVTANQFEITGETEIQPEKSVVLGPVKVISLEYPNISCRCLDVILNRSEILLHSPLIRQLLEEFFSQRSDTIVALRGKTRWVQTFEPIRLEFPTGLSEKLKQKGVYLVTGGLGGIGLELAEYLAKNGPVQLILTGRSNFPEKNRWDDWLATHDENDMLSLKIRKLKALEALGSEIFIFRADVSNWMQMQGVIKWAMEKFGRIDGVVHSAGLPDGEMIQRRSRKKSEDVLTPKIKGTLVLYSLLKDIRPGFIVLCSSISSIHAAIGQVAYCAANAFMDAFANRVCSTGGIFTISINWERWIKTGIAVMAEEMHRKMTGKDMEGGITPGEGVEAFRRILADRLPQVIVTPQDLGALVKQNWGVETATMIDVFNEDVTSKKVYKRPALETEYIAPGNETEQVLSDIWVGFFGFDQVGVGDDFFELGGDSLKALVIINKIHKKLGMEVPIATFFNHPTIRGLSGYIAANTEKSNFLAIAPAVKKEYYPLSAAQRRLFILQQMELDNTTYNQFTVVLFEGTADKNRLENTFRKLIQRHESMRTSFDIINDEPMQRIHNEVPFEVHYRDSAVVNSPAIIEDRIKNFIQPFDLSRLPLLRVELLKLEDKTHLLMVDTHHIIADGLSMEILVSDFKRLYNGEELRRLSIQYKDFSEWKNSEGKKEALKNQRNYWLQQFGDAIPVLNIPTDYPRPPIQGFAGELIAFEINVGETRALKEMARGRGGTLFMVLLAIYNIFLAKLSSQEDIIVGIPTAGRMHIDLEQVIGMFVNTLAMRNYPSGDKTFMDFLDEVKEKALQAFENQEYEFDELVETIVLQRDTSRNPLFDATFILQNIYGLPQKSTSEKIEGLRITPFGYKSRTAKFDLTLIAVEVADKIFLSFEYCTLLFKRETIDRFIQYFNEIIASLIESPDKTISGIEIIPEEEKSRVLTDFNATEEEYPLNKTIPRIFEAQVERIPGNIAVIASSMGADIQLSYSELNERSGRLASWLRDKGVEPDTVVGIMVERSVEMITGIIGILKSGGAYLPIAPLYGQERIDYMLTDSGANILLTTSNLAKGGEKMGRWEGEIYYMEALLSSSYPLPFLPSYLLNSSNLAYIIYTSGSTGKPKGVMIEHISVLNLLFAMQCTYPFIQTDTYLLKTSYVFDVSVTELFGWYMGGGRLVILERGGEKDPQAILASIERNSVTHVNFVPSMFNAFIDHVKGENRNRLSSLKYIFLAGEVLLPAWVEKFRNLGTTIFLENIYGPTESTIYASRYSLAEWEGPGPIPIGKPLQNLKLYILDTKDCIQPINLVGELCISGIGLARGYLNRPDLTAEKFIDFHHSSFIIHHSKLYCTGDLARWLPDGNIEFRGRMDQQVKIRGFRIEPGEIEGRLSNHQSIKEAVVVAREGESGDKYLCAYIVLGTELGVSELREYLAKDLPDYMIPSYFVYLERIPLTPNGKLDRKALPDPKVETGREYAAPRDKVEEKLIEIWADMLGIDESDIGIDTNFFYLGGHSLKATILAARIHKEFNVKVPLGEIFKTPTIRGLSEFIKRSVEEKYKAIEPAEEKEYYPLSPVQKRMYVLQQMQLESKSYNIPMVMTLEGDINYENLQDTFRQLIKRHESLRTSFAMMKGETVQIIHKEVGFMMDYCESDEENVRKIAANFLRPFDLSSAPLLRAGLIKINRDKHVLMVDIHHIISDGVSQRIMIKEFTTIYRGEKLPPLRIQYKDFSQWQNRLLESGSMNKQKEYWLSKFKAGAVPVLNMPLDYPRPPVRNVDAGDYLIFSLDEGLSKKIVRIMGKMQVTLSMMLLAVYNILLYLYSRQEDIVIGIIITGRTHADLENVIGMFVNTIPLRSYPEKNKKFGEFLTEVKQNSLSTFENQDFPLDELVIELGLQGETGRSALFDVAFILDNIEKKEVKNTVFELKLLQNENENKNENEFAKFDLALYASEIGDTINLGFRYSTQLFKRSTIEKFKKYYIEIMEQVAGDIDIPLKDIVFSHDFLVTKSRIQDDESDFKL